MKITVIGAGPGGLAYAAVLTMRGHAVTLFELPEFRVNIESLIEKKSLRMSGYLQGQASLANVTDDLPTAVDGADCIVIATHAAAHSILVGRIAELLHSGQSILLSPGYVGGALEFRSALAECSPGLDPDIAETQVFPFACRKVDPDHVRIGALKRGFLAARADLKRPSTALDLVVGLFDHVRICQSLLETGLNETNFIVHATITLTNLGFVEGPGEWRFYRDGLTRRVGRLIDAIDAERLNVGSALGLRLKSLPEWFNIFYGDQGMQGTDTYSQLGSFPPFAESPGPRSLHHRYFSEDIPYGLVPLAGLGRYVHVATDLVDSLIRLGSAVCSTDFMSTGRNPDWATILGAKPHASSQASNNG